MAYFDYAQKALPSDEMDPKKAIALGIQPAESASSNMALAGAGIQAGGALTAQLLGNMARKAEQKRQLESEGQQLGLKTQGQAIAQGGASQQQSMEDLIKSFRSALV